MSIVLKKKLRIFITFVGLIFLILTVLGLGYYIIVYQKALEPCMTAVQVQQDPARCLYIYNNNVYELGTIDAPYNSIQCGTDITNILPPGTNVTQEIDPNLVTNLCVEEPVITE